MRTSESIARGAPVHGLRTPVLAACALVACALAIGCSAEELPEAMQQTAQQLFATRAWPALGRCLGCHATRPTIDFLAPGTPAEAYPTLLAFQPPIIDVSSPASSLVLTMGKHTGPPLLAPDADAVLAWLEAERVERVADGGATVAVGPVSLLLGAVTAIDLGHGATLRFTASAAADGIGLRQIELAAGPRGLHVVHPLFVTHPPRVPARIDASDAFGDVDLALAAGATEPLGGGAAVLPSFDPADPISIDFRTLEAP